MFGIVIPVSCLFYACKKEISSNSSNKGIIVKVNSWLDQQKNPAQPMKAGNIEALRNNLDYSKLQIEESGENEQILVIPVNESFKILKNIDQNTIPNLVLILSKDQNIRKGNVVLFIPENDKHYSAVPKNTFHDILNTGDVKTDGLFRFLSVTGRWEYQLDYKNGKLKSFGLIKPKNSSGEASRTNTLTCTDWYLVVDWYDLYGNYVESTYEFISESCNDCDNPMYQSLCPDAGGGGGTNYEYEYEASREQNWTVYNGPNSVWYVAALDRLKGRRNSNEPQRGYFTGITNLSADCINCSSNSVGWNWDYQNSSYSNQTASCQIKGHLSWLGTPDYFVDQTHYYSFQNVFP